ncbi:fatty acid synthase-like [Trichogramma pretiosum]|uniref:fatty acid synthase-like n=1 Tax=Trichogramma pretiosum TaxID=7493 RepID=UPI0006C9D0F0|nr:fatty acid synthase-like [Trichogramma pretiosum]
MTGHRVVISGVAGRFPNSDNVTELQNNLLNQVDCTTTEHGRWEFDSPKIPQRLGKCNNIEKFDRVFFGVHTKLCAIMDPMSRLLLEHSFEAIMDAGVNPRHLRGANIGVYTATNLSESEKTVFHHKVQHDGFGIMGSSKAMVPNRISFFLGLVGPSVNIDSGDAGSGAALERAYHAIKNGRIDGAIVAGSILNLHPHISYQLRALGLLSTDGFTRSFDDNAGGHTRSDGVAVLFLQRMTDSKRIYQEVIHARAIHSDCNNLNEIMYPTMESQVQVMQDLLNESGLKPDDIDFLEASGVAIKKQDTEELEAIDRVYGKRKKPLLIGSIKSNIGNAICTGTINSIVKMIVASETGQIPPNLHYEEPNSQAAGLQAGRQEVVTELTPWTGQYSSINTTSTVGVFSNVLLKSPNIEKKNDGVPEDDIPRLVIVSGRTEEAIATMLDFVEGRPVDVELLQMMYDIFQSEINAHLFRGFTVVPAKEMLAPETKKREILFNTGENKEIWWVFSGMGSQWVGMGEALLKLPIFEAAIRKCDAVLKPLGYDIFRIITEKDPKMFDHIINSFVGIAAIQIGLVDVLKAVGLEPDFIIGHSVGELGCAYADGCFTAEQMVLAALSRGLASTESNLQKGSMAAVGLGFDQVKPLCPPDIDVACHNGPESTTISGPAESMKKFVADLTAKGIFAREVPCSNIAYHSRYIAAAGPKLLERLQKVIPKPNPRSSKWISTSVPQSEWNTLKARLCSAEYHTNNLLSPVLFEESSRVIPANAVCIEIAPHGLLQAILKRSLPETCINIALTRRGHPDNLEVLLTALGKMYNVGMQPQISNLYPKVSYPVGRGTPSISSLIRWDHTTDWLVNYYESKEPIREGEKVLEINLLEPENQHLLPTVVNGKIPVPVSKCLVHAWEILQSFDKEQVLDIVFEDIKIHNVLTVVVDNSIKLNVMVAKGTGNFEVSENETLLISGTVKETKAPSQDRLGLLHSKKTEPKYELTKVDFYQEMSMRGAEYPDEFKNVSKATIDGNNALIKWNDNWLTFIDNALQLFSFGNDSRKPQMPLTIRRIVIDHKLQEDTAQNSVEMHAIVDRKVNYLCVGGLEMQGVKFSDIPKSLEQNQVGTDELSIIPNKDRSDLSLSTSLRLILQIILENIFSIKLQRIQIVATDNHQNWKFYSSAMFDIPEASSFTTEIISYDEATFNKALTVLDDIKQHDIQEVARKLSNGKFLLVFVENKEADMFTKTANSLGLGVVFTRNITNITLILLKKKQSFKKVHILNATNNVDEVVKKIKNTKLAASDERIVILSNTKNHTHILDLVEQIKNQSSLEKVRIYGIEEPKVSEKIFTEEFYTKQLELDLLINLLTQKKLWATLRQMNVELNPQMCKFWKADKKHSHDPNSIAWVGGSIHENIVNPVKVEYAALNSQDILIVHENFYADTSEMVGQNRLNKISPGLEYSGLDSKGNRVMGVCCGNAMSNIVSADPDLMWEVPKSWSLEDAATVPLSYVLAYSALKVKAEVKKDEKVMLTNVCDGIGLALLQLAVDSKCDVFVTYNTEIEKKLILSVAPKLPNNRLLKLWRNSFRDDVLLATSGKGVDVVICNQGEIKSLEVFFTMTKHNGRVILISDLSEDKIHQSIGMEIFLREISLYSVVPKRILTSDKASKKTISDLVRQGINSGSVKPLARTVYARESLTQAYNELLKNSNGKIIVKVQPDDKSKEAVAIPRHGFSSVKSYLVLEGLSTFSLELIDLLIVRGARRFVIASSSGTANGYETLRLNLWQSYGVKIILRKDIDTSQPQNIKGLIKEANSLGPIDGIIDLRRMDTRIKTKESTSDAITQIVDMESRTSCPELSLFLVCSSVNVTSTLKMKMVSKESEAKNDAVLKLLQKRKKDGLHGLLINLGIDSEQNNSLLPVKKYLQKLDEILALEETSVNVVYYATNTNEVEEDEIDTLANITDPEQREAEIFEAGLYEQYGVTSDNFAHIQV